MYSSVVRVQRSVSVAARYQVFDLTSFVVPVNLSGSFSLGHGLEIPVLLPAALRKLDITRTPC